MHIDQLIPANEKVQSTKWSKTKKRERKEKKRKEKKKYIGCWARPHLLLFLYDKFRMNVTQKEEVF